MPNIDFDNMLGEIESHGCYIYDFIYKVIDRHKTELSSVYDIVKYPIEDIGLSLRPYLFLLGYNAEQRCELKLDGVNICSAIELQQISTLVIDDVLDNSAMRNNRPTVTAAFGPEKAITAGIILSSLGNELLSELSGPGELAKITPDILRLFSSTHRKIYTGQFMDLDVPRSSNFSLDEYLEMIYLTTGSFIETSIVLGGIVGMSSNSTIQNLKLAGRKIGVAYQLRDDILDIVGDPNITGKPHATDVLEKRMRAPIIFALQSSDIQSTKRLEELYFRAKDLSVEQNHEIVRLIRESGALEKCVNLVKNLCDETLKIICEMEDTTPYFNDRIRFITNLIATF